MSVVRRQDAALGNNDSPHPSVPRCGAEVVKGARQPLAGFSYTVVRHERDGKFAKVALKCLGYPTEGVQPVEWEFVLRVPKADLDKWPLDLSVRLAVTP
jgi:hypothetical protein